MIRSVRPKLLTPLCEFAECRNEPIGEITDKRTGHRTKVCRQHLEEFMGERGPQSSSYPPRPLSVSERIRRCTTPLQVHEIVGDSLKIEASPGTRRKWHKLAERTIQRLKGAVVFS